MNLTLDLNAILQGVAILLIGIGATGIFSIKKKVNQICTTLGKIETWQTGHEKIDDERHQESKNNIASIWARIDKA